MISQPIFTHRYLISHPA